MDGANKPGWESSKFKEIENAHREKTLGRSQRRIS